MGAAAADGPVLVASNRGPISFSQGPDGQLSARRGGGGMVSGLLTVASQTDLLWVCAALSDALLTSSVLVTPAVRLTPTFMPPVVVTTA